MKLARILLAAAISICVGAGAADDAKPAVIVATPDESVPVHRSLDGQLKPTLLSSGIACSARNGDEIEIVKAMALDGVREFWLLVKVLSGPCTGTEGWIRGTHAKPRT